MHILIKILYLGIFKYDVYKTPNIGLFVRANDRIIIVPFGFAETKTIWFCRNKDHQTNGIFTGRR
jgi:hypothetical protein